MCDVFDPLDHLLSRDFDTMALTKLLLEPVIGQMVIEAGQDNVDGQAESEPAFRYQAWQRRYCHTRVAARAGVLRTDGATAAHFRLWRICELH